MSGTVLDMDERDVRVELRPGVARDLLQRDGDTVAAWAERADISENYLYKLLAGERRCSWQLLCRLAAALRVQPTTIADIRVRKEVA